MPAAYMAMRKQRMVVMYATGVRSHVRWVTLAQDHSVNGALANSKVLQEGIQRRTKICGSGKLKLQFL